MSIAARRQVIARAQGDSAYFDALQRDGAAAIAAETGVVLPADMTVHVVVEPGDGHFSGVLPRAAALADGLPELERLRDVWENLLLSTVTMDDKARDELLADPVRFAKDISGNFPGRAPDVLVESPTDTYLVIDQAEQDELDESALDLVSAGFSVTGGSACTPAAKI